MEGRAVDIRIWRASAVLGFGAVLALSGCSAPAEQPPSIDLPPTSLSETPSPTTGLESLSPAPPESLPTSPLPVAPIEPPAQPSPTNTPEPFPVQCLEGTPGPAIWSDGTTRYSQWCFDTRGGQRSLDAESESGGPANGRGYECGANGCFWPDGTPVIGADRCGRLCGEPPTSGDVQSEWIQCIAVKTTEQCRAELDGN